MSAKGKSPSASPDTIKKTQGKSFDTCVVQPPEEVSPNASPTKKLKLRATSPSDSTSCSENSRGALCLENLSNPPTRKELEQYSDVPHSSLPKTYKRTYQSRVFVNRNLSLKKINYFGFDMDYTIAVYSSPKYEAAAYKLICLRLVEMGYPSEVSSFVYDASFAIRGLFFDTVLGNLLKVDEFGNILVCIHGKSQIYSNEKIRKIYPNKFVLSDEIGKRFYVLNTLFNLPETCLYGELIEYFDHHPDYEKTLVGVCGKKLMLTYLNIYNDVRAAVDYVHLRGELKTYTMNNLKEYVIKDPRIPVFLDKLQAAKKYVFLVTNSDYEYTEKMMSYLFESEGDHVPQHLRRNWKTFFDVIIVDAKKPAFFGEGTSLREVNLKTGSLKIGSVKDSFEKGKVYSGGSSSIFCQFTGAQGKDVLYMGDHIFGDILKSKKEHAWRTFLVVPELLNELHIGVTSKSIYNHLRNLQFLLAETYRGLSIESSDLKANPVRESIRDTVKVMDASYNPRFGSMFRSGTRQTFFAMQAKRYADLYAHSYLNLLNYPLCYAFLASDELMPHEKAALLGDSPE